jgi:cell wall assembly regulator SMI1
MTVPESHVEAVWERIDTWLTRHAPRYRERLRPPAEPDQLTDAEREMGVVLPSDLTEWWRCADGFQRTPPTTRPLGHLLPDQCDPYSVAEAIERRSMHLRVGRETLPAHLVDQWEAWQNRCRQDPAGNLYPNEASALWLPEWLPIAGDGAGGGLFVDLRPGPEHGCVVQFQETGHAAAPTWPDTATMLVQVADALESLAMDWSAEIVFGSWHVPCA